MDDINDWGNFSRQRTGTEQCRTLNCGGTREASFAGPAGTEVWHCERCHAANGTNLPFNPKQAPEGRSEGYLALKTLAIFAPIFTPVDMEALYRIVRPYFAAGWCVRDVLHAMDYSPDGTTHWGRGPAWISGEPPDTTLARLLTRLRTWRWREADHVDGVDIMPGPYTAMVKAMAANAEVQRHRRAMNEIEYHRRDDRAREAEAKGSSVAARRVAAVSAIQGRRMHAEARAREAEAIAAQIAESRAASQRWLEMIGDADSREPEPPASDSPAA